MIGRRIIDKLTVAEEDVLLGTKLTLGATFDQHGRRCLGGALDLAACTTFWNQQWRGRKAYNWYNCLCQRLAGVPASQHRDGMELHDICWRQAPSHLLAGAARAGDLIRNRILSNRARRILQNAPVSRDTEVDAQAGGESRFGRGE